MNSVINRVVSVMILVVLLALCGCKFIDRKSFEKFSTELAGGISKVPQMQLAETGTDEGETVVVGEDGRKILKDSPKGYMISFPGNMEFDTSISPKQIKAFNDVMTVTVTREWSPYEDTWYYIDNYMNNYYTNEHYNELNDIVIRENTRFIHRGAEAQKISLYRVPSHEAIQKHRDEYSYFFIISNEDKRAFFRIMFKYDNYDKVYPEIERIISSFEETEMEGKNTFKLKASVHSDDVRDYRTRKLYNDICQSDSLRWGIFVDGAYLFDEDRRALKELERNIDFEFDFALHYVNLGWRFPKEALTEFYENGKITELTLQLSNFNNSDLMGKNINFAIYDGLADDMIREFARSAKDFGYPFLFRLNNEMNSDWVNYSGVASLSDPEIFIDNWRRIYNIFREEGVDNAIWIFNPNTTDCPPANWNSYISYYPGDEYVHMIGMTGYNTGTYYGDLYGETWRSFDEIYEEPYNEYMEVFSDFPFIITEFASSSVGGDKAEWIRDMFFSIKKYDNIKMALWWSSADYDMREDTYKNVARPYFLDENEETLNAFREGIAEYK